MTNEDLTTFRAELDRIDNRLAELQPQRTEAHASINATLQQYTDGSITLDELQAGQMRRLALDETYNALTARRAELEKAIADGLAQIDRESVLQTAVATAEAAQQRFADLARERKELDEFLDRHGLQIMNTIVAIRAEQARFRNVLSPLTAKYAQRAALVNAGELPPELLAELEGSGLTNGMLRTVTANQLLLENSEYEPIFIFIQNFYAQPGKRELLQAA